MRAGVTSRAHGWLISGTELAVFLAPFAVAQYLPLYFYGALLAVFGVEIAGDCESPLCIWEGVGAREAWRYRAPREPVHTAFPTEPLNRAPRRAGLVRSRHKVTRSEYILLLLTFLAIMQARGGGGAPRGQGVYVAAAVRC